MNNGFVITAVIIQLIIGLLVVAQLIALVALVVVIKNLIVLVQEHLDPLVDKANNLLITLNEVMQTVQGRTEQIADSTATATDKMADRMERTSRVMQTAITAPIIHSAGMAAGIRGALASWRAARARRKGHPHAE